MEKVERIARIRRLASAQAQLRKAAQEVGRDFGSGHGGYQCGISGGAHPPAVGGWERRAQPLQGVALPGARMQAGSASVVPLEHARWCTQAERARTADEVQRRSDAMALELHARLEAKHAAAGGQLGAMVLP